MILLDTNYLIRALVPASAEAGKVIAWTGAGKDLCTSAVCWYEFLCGPVTAEGIDIIYGLIQERVLPFTSDQAAEASRLFNATGRSRRPIGRTRRLRVDAMIAAAAIISNASLATDNGDDFSLFTPLGLRLLGA